MDEETKLITIKPLPAKDINKNPNPAKVMVSETPPKRKVGRPPLTDEQRKNKKKTNDGYTLTPARKQAITKARFARQMKRELKNKGLKVIAAADEPVLAEPPQNDLLQKIGRLETSLLSMNTHFEGLLKKGVFKDNNDAQAKSNLPQPPLELRTADMSKPAADSFVQVSGIAKSTVKVEPEVKYSPVVENIETNYGINDSQFMYW